MTQPDDDGAVIGGQNEFHTRALQHLDEATEGLTPEGLVRRGLAAVDVRGHRSRKSYVNSLVEPGTTAHHQLTLLPYSARREFGSKMSWC